VSEHTKYRTIVADPPWSYKEGLWQRSKSRAKSHYPTLSVQEISQLPVCDIAADDAYLWLWATNRHLLTGCAAVVMNAWGFRPLTVLTWDKVSLGLGHYLRNITEHVAFGVRGSPGGFAKRQPVMPTLFREKRGKHSAKPDTLYDMIHDVCYGPYLELFARKKRYGWDSWGEDVGDPLDIGFNPRRWVNDV